MVKKILDKIKKKHKIYVGFYKANEEVDLPYIIYFNKEKSFKADNSNFKKVDEWYIEVYSDDEYSFLEKEIEKELVDICYSKDKEYITSEEMFVTIFRFDGVRKE